MIHPHLPLGWQALACRSEMQYTPEHIAILRENEIFVFGSNLMGRKTGGDAYTARRVFNADMGIKEGPTGQAYAVPILDEAMRSVSPEALCYSLGRLILYALDHPEQTFYLTELGRKREGLPADTVRDLLWEAIRLISEDAYKERAVPSNLLIPQRFTMPRDTPC